MSEVVGAEIAGVLALFAAVRLTLIKWTLLSSLQGNGRAQKEMLSG